MRTDGVSLAHGLSHGLRHGILGLALLMFASSSVRADDALLVAAASSMTEAITAAAVAYEADTGIPVTVSFAASSVLARQVISGAPVDAFVSANPQWMEETMKAGAIDRDGVRAVASNRLVIVAGVAGRFGDAEPEAILRQAARDGVRIAVADPDHVPAGIYAAEALRALGLFATLNPLLVRLPNVRAALAFVERGETGLGIVYRTDARIASNAQVLATFAAGDHTPIRYLAGAVRGSARGTAFVAFLTSPAGQAILAAAGFAPPSGMNGNTDG